MKRLLLALALVNLPGCTWYDAMFDVFGDHYSGGGTTWEEKRNDYNESARAYGADQ